MMSSMMKVEPTRRKAAVGDELECDQRGGREDIKWLGGSGFWEHLPLAHTLVMFPMMAIMELGGRTGPTGMSSSLTSQRRGHLDNLTDALGGGTVYLGDAK